jgi:NADP-dependent alcohol dehydrogenase
MTQFIYHNPTRVIFGAGQLDTLGSAIAQGQRVLLLSGGGSINSNGVRDRVLQALSHCTVVEFSGIEPNPRYETILKAARVIAENQLDFIVGVGGGSVADAAKFLGAVAAIRTGDAWDSLVAGHYPAACLPVGIVLTLPATGSESNAVSVINHDARGLKLPFASPHLYPRFAILDPETTESLPVTQRANGVVDAMSHVLEQYLVNVEPSPIQFGYSETLLRTLIEYGPRLLADNDLESRHVVMFAANQALNGLIGTGIRQDWSSHMIGHALTALYGIDHARTLSAVMPSLYRHQIASKRAMLERCGRAVFALDDGADLAERTVAAIEEFFLQMGLPVRLNAFERPVSVAAVIAHLETAGQFPLGENADIDAPEVAGILKRAGAVEA